MKNNFLEYYIIFLILFTLLSLNTFCYSQTINDSLKTIIKSDTLTLSDSLSNKIEMSHAPTIAFGIVGAWLGPGIAEVIYPSDKRTREKGWIEGEFGFTIKKKGLIGFGIGALIGGYIGYRLAKRDVEREKKELKSRIKKTNSKNDKRK